MNPDMSILDVIEEIRRLRQSGKSLGKKRIKQTHPQLMKNALFYFPSWEHALRSTEI